MDRYNLFRKVLLSYGKKTTELPITLGWPILTNIEYSLDDCMHLEESIEQRVDRLVLLLQTYKKGEHEVVTDVYMMYSVICFIDANFEHYKQYIDEIIKASNETLLIPDQRDRGEYWLSAWHPQMVVDKESFNNAIIQAQQIWQQESSELRKYLLTIIFMPPFVFDHTSWDKLRME